MENYKFSTLEYKRPDLEARRAQLAQWKDAVEHAESYDALRALLFEMDRAACELFTQYAIAHIRHTLTPATPSMKRRSTTCRTPCPPWVLPR